MTASSIAPIDANDCRACRRMAGLWFDSSVLKLPSRQPALKNNGGGAIVNVLSALAWISMPGTGTYSVSKAAAWALTNGLRGELQAQNTQVLAAHMGYMDTDMVAAIDAQKTPPAEVARIIVAALEIGDDEVLVDDISKQVKQGLGAPRGAYLGTPLAG
jgi:NAD(P)-dependent dehydrogenase (short-subunit alcohol dehydrogenase family)